MKPGKIASGICVGCWLEFSREYRTRRPDRCQECADRAEGKAQRHCDRCGAQVPRRKQRCVDCRSATAAAKADRQQEKRNPPRPCKGCGSLFRQAIGRSNGGFCAECRPVGSRCDLHRQREKEARWEKNPGKAGARKSAIEAAREAAAAQRAAREAERAALIIERPWLAPGLTAQEKRRVRYRCDPLFNLSERVRIQMRNRRRFRNMEHTIRKAVAGKVTTPGIEKFVGYTMADLRKHLEAQFDDFMCWEAFADGSIHIDHKRPVSTFDLDDPDQVRDCWALSNLQPLWRPDNMRKGARWKNETAGAGSAEFT